MRRSYTAVVEQDSWWTGEFETEPYECAWACELLIFVRALDAKGSIVGATAQVELSPDGLHWVPEGASVALPYSKDQVSLCRLSQFGNYVRLRGSVDQGEVRVMVYFVLKE